MRLEFILKSNTELLSADPMLSELPLEKKKKLATFQRAYSAITHLLMV